MQSVLIILSAFYAKCPYILSALYAKRPYYAVLSMQVSVCGRTDDRGAHLGLHQDPAVDAAVVLRVVVGAGVTAVVGAQSWWWVHPGWTLKLPTRTSACADSALTALS